MAKELDKLYVYSGLIEWNDTHRQLEELDLARKIEQNSFWHDKKMVFAYITPLGSKIYRERHGYET